MKYLLMTLLSLNLAWAANVDLKKSELKWTGTKVTGKHFGMVPISSAMLKMNDKGMITSGTVVADLKNLTVTDLKAGEGKEKLEGHLKNADFFDVEKYPTAKIDITGDNGKELMAKLTIKNKTHEVKIPYTKKGKNYMGEFKFNRAKFDVKYNSGSFFKGLGDKLIHDDVTLAFKIMTK